MNGIINVYKEKGYTSHDVVAKLRGILKQKKIGHTGTLDPDAEGVLPVCLGNATKLCDMITAKEKTYRTVMLLGIETDTQDISGKIINERPVEVSETEVIKTINAFVGPYNQIPPMYSAIKINGKKMYELARAGIEVEREARPVYIYEINIIEIKLPRVTMEVKCSKGTYIRTLCHDIGLKLGTYACMEELLRTQSGVFGLDTAFKLADIEAMRDNNTLEDKLIRVESVFAELPSFSVNEKWNKYLYNGNRMPLGSFDIKKTVNEWPVLIRVYDSNNAFIGVYEYKQDAADYKPVKLFLN